MIGYPVVFRCCECTVEEQTMEHLEKHIWSRHLQAFPFRCAQCDFPAISCISLLEHYAQDHAQVTTVEFKRNLDEDKRFRKMIAESIAIEFQENSQTHQNQEIAVLEPMNMPQDLILTSNQYETIVDHRATDDEDFGVLEDDENVEEMMDDDEEDGYMDELGHPVFIGAHDDHTRYIMDDDISEQGAIRPTNSYHMKYIRTRRMDKLIDTVVVNAAQRISPDSPSNQTNEAMLLDDESDSRKMGRFSCDRCDKSFKFQSKLNEHLRTHFKVQPYSCPDCFQKFTQKGALTTHMRQHTGDRPYKCQWDCGKSFISASAARQHEKIHSGYRPYMCQMCGKDFTKRSHLTRHLKNIHNKVLLADDELMQGSDEAVGIAMRTEPDMEPRGEEKAVVNDIVEKIHEEKFSRQIE